MGALVRFQAKYRLEDLDVNKEEHHKEEKKLLGTYKILWYANIMYHAIRLTVPPMVENFSTDKANKIIWMIFVAIDILLSVLIIVASIVSVTRVLAATQKNYNYMYQKFKVSYTWVAICLVVSFLVLLITAITYFYTLWNVDCDKDGKCATLLDK